MAGNPEDDIVSFLPFFQMFGCGSVAQIVLSKGTHGGFLTVNLAFGFAVTLGILIAGQVSGMGVCTSQLRSSRSKPLVGSRKQSSKDYHGLEVNGPWSLS